MKIYCDYIQKKGKNDVDRIYHDTKYGFPVKNDNELFGRLILEINQAGLSWTTILNKQKSIKKAYNNFNIEKIARYKESDINRLLKNTGVIRNRLKIKAIIYNANQVLNIKKTHKTFKNWLDTHRPLTHKKGVALFKIHFKFTGIEITNEFLLSTGYLKIPHKKICPIYKKLLKVRS